MPILSLESFQEASVIDGINGRVYSFGDKSFPSITTVLGKTSDHSGLDKWRERVGEEKANEISRKSTKIGTNLHALCEDYFYGRKTENAASSARAMFRTLQPTLSKRVGHIYGIECPLYSIRLGVAGRTDLICDFDGERSICDYKSNHGDSFKDEKYIIDYKLQTTFYALAYAEMGYPVIKQGVLLIANNFCTQVVKFNVSDFILPLQKRIALYRK